MSGSPSGALPLAGNAAPVSQPSNVDLRSFQEAPQMSLADQLLMFQQQRGAQAQSSNPYQQMQDQRYEQARSQPTVSMPGQLLQNYMKGQAYTPMELPAPVKPARLLGGEQIQSPWRTLGRLGGGGYQ